jgi:hypothetical protein
MNRKILPIVYCLLSSLPLFAQTLYVPNGFSSSGIGTSIESGHVGIGTSAPQARLHIIDGGLRHGGTGEISIDAPGVVGGRFKIGDNGNVGIGVTNPLHKLDIVVNGGTGLHVGGNNSSHVGADIRITRAGSGQGVGRAPALQFNDNGSGSGYLLQGSSGGLQFFSLYNNGAWTERMRVTPEGNVGIGTDNPWFGRLQVESNTVGDNALRLEKGKFSMAGSSRFEVDAPGVFGGRFIIHENGNIGIGTTDTRGYKLAIHGKTVTEEVVVKLENSWPDYVFSNNYQLPSLEVVENYIRENKHLPEVPSAEDVQKNGVSLGEMNAILLKKIEELTLHLIRQEKQINALTEEIKILKQ